MSIKKFGNTNIIMYSIKSITLIIAILCVSILYAEENTYIKQQGASCKELTWDFGI
jgi:hypothetical protein